MKVPYVDLAAQYRTQREDLLKIVDTCMASGRYILGEEVEKFEQAFAILCHVKHAIGVANGTDALILALRALDIGHGDEVITVANSWVSSASSIALLGATPVFIDVKQDQNMDPRKIEAAITPRTKAIMPVHLTGKCCDMDSILAIAEKKGLKIIEDAAQAVGASYRDRMSGSMGDIGCFSLHPLKNLNAMGDAGIITTNNDDLAKRLRLLHNHGLKARGSIQVWGMNSRLDNLQAAILNHRIVQLQDVIEKRRRFATIYRKGLSAFVQCPKEDEKSLHTYHLFVIQSPDRDELKRFLKEKGISTAIHYPTPLHLQECSQKLGYKKGDLPHTESQAESILSLPISHSLQDEQVHFVIEQIQRFFQKSP